MSAVLIDIKLREAYEILTYSYIFNFRNNWANLNTSYVVLENTLKIARRMTKYKITGELNYKADIRPVSGQFATTTDSPPKNAPPLSKGRYIPGVPTAVGCVV